jgi:hypothetical protein
MPEAVNAKRLRPSIPHPPARAAIQLSLKQFVKEAIVLFDLHVPRVCCSL